MLKFTNSTQCFENLGAPDKLNPVTQYCSMIFKDDELKREFCEQVEQKLNDYDFTFYEDSKVYFKVKHDSDEKIAKIEMFIVEPNMSSQTDLFTRTESDMMYKRYRPKFEEYYEKIKPY